MYDEFAVQNAIYCSSVVIVVAVVVAGGGGALLLVPTPGTGIRSFMSSCCNARMSTWTLSSLPVFSLAGSFEIAATRLESAPL